MRVSRDGSAEDTVALAAMLLVAVMLFGSAMLTLITQGDPRFQPPLRGTGVLLCLVCLGAALGVQLGLTHQRWLDRVPWLAVTAALCSAALFLLCDSWTLLGMGIAVVALAFNGARRWVAVAVLGAVCHTYLLTHVDELGALIGIPAVNWVSAAVLYAMTRLLIVLQELRRTREHLARLQVDEERHRISRDLHDIIGRTLAAASLRNQTALRLLDLDADKCRHQLEQLQLSISSGQAQLRGLTSGPVIIGLVSELDSASRLFTRLGVRVAVEAASVQEREVDQLLAAVVREAVTNSLKHSRPRECRITVRREVLGTVLSIVNDGVLSRRQTGVGTGLADLRDRLCAVGGTLTAGVLDGAQFRVIARVPDSRQDAPPALGHSRGELPSSTPVPPPAREAMA